MRLVVAVLLMGVAIQWAAAAPVCDPADRPDDSGCRTYQCSNGLWVARPRSAGTTCRISTAPCDAQEKCNGTSTLCPADALSPAGTLCRGSVGACDVPEYCTGTSPSCPGDGFSGASTPCRASAGACDVPEYCTGASASCPADAYAATSVQCNDGNLCTYSDHCNGTGGCIGTSITCQSDACSVRSCNGTSACQTTLLNGNVCGPSEYACACNGAGGCALTTTTTRLCYDPRGNVTAMSTAATGGMCPSACP